MTPLSRLRRLPPRGTTRVAGETPATAFRCGLLRGHWKGLLRGPQAMGVRVVLPLL